MNERFSYRVMRRTGKIQKRRLLTQEEKDARKREREERRRKAREEYLARFESCPHCGIKDYLSVDLNGLDSDWVRCNKCNCTGPAATGEEEAIRLWNIRL